MRKGLYFYQRKTIFNPRCMENSHHSNSVMRTLAKEYETMVTQGDATILTEDAYHQLITYYESELLFERALDIADKAMEVYSFTPEFFIRKADILLSLKLGDEALDQLIKAEGIAPSEIHISLVKAKTLAFLNRQEEAKQILGDLKSYNDAEVLADVFIVEGYIHQLNKDYESMLESLVIALKKCPTKSSALESLWIATEVCRKFKECAELMTFVINNDPYNYQAWYYLGHCYSFMCEYEMAVDAYEYSFIINEKFESAYKDCADLCSELKKYSKAIKFYKEAIDTFGPDAEYYFDIAFCLYQTKKYKDAKRYFIKSLKLDPYNDEGFYYFGLCLAHEKRWNSAINALMRAIDLDEMREEYYASLADIYLKLGDKAKTEQYFQMAIECGPEQSQIWLAYARFLVSENRLKEAMKILKEADDFSVGADLLYGMAACLYLKGKNKKALDMMAEALLEDFNSYKIMFDFVPTLQKDPEVKSMIAYYRSELNLL